MGDMVLLVLAFGWDIFETGLAAGAKKRRVFWRTGLAMGGIWCGICAACWCVGRLAALFVPEAALDSAGPVSLLLLAVLVLAKPALVKLARKREKKGNSRETGDILKDNLKTPEEKAAGLLAADPSAQMAGKAFFIPAAFTGLTAGWLRLPAEGMLIAAFMGSLLLLYGGQIAGRRFPAGRELSFWWLPPALLLFLAFTYLVCAG